MAFRQVPCGLSAPWATYSTSLSLSPHVQRYTGGAESLAQSLVRYKNQPETATVSVPGNSIEVSLLPQPELIHSSVPLTTAFPAALSPRAISMTSRPAPPHPAPGRQKVLSERLCLPWLYHRHEQSSAQWALEQLLEKEKGKEIKVKELLHCSEVPPPGQPRGSMPETPQMQSCSD